MKRRAWLLPTALVAALLALPGTSATAAVTPSVSITADKASYTAGQTAALTVKVKAQNLDLTVSYQLPGSTKWVAFGGGRNTQTGTLHESAYVRYNVKMRAQLTDSKNGNAVRATDVVSLPVRAKLSTTSHGGGSVSGSYLVYSKGYAPSFRSTDSSPYPGKRCLRHQVQKFTGKAWVKVATGACKVEDKSGRVIWKWAGKHASGVKFRVRAISAADKRNRAGTGSWAHFRFR